MLVRKQRKIRKIIISLLILTVGLYVLRGGIFQKCRSFFIDKGIDMSSPIFTIEDMSGDSSFISRDELYSPNVILVRLKDNSVLMQKNSEEKIYPASLTKIMTAILALEKLSDLEEEIELSSPIFKDLEKENASMAGFRPNERVRAIDLLYGVMLPSGGECCIGLAEHIAGSEQRFVTLMNKKAAALGMKYTHFTNTTGIQDQKHYTTVKDLAILLAYALKNETFREIFNSPKHTTEPTNVHPHGVTLRSTLFDRIYDLNLEGNKILGGKTGYTDEAGLCLASFTKKDGVEYILITAGAEGNHNTEQFNIMDAFKVYNSIGEY